MDWTIGQRIKSRNILRLQEVNKRKKTEEGSPSLSSSHKKQKRTRPKDYDSDIEDITPANHNNNNNNKKKKSPHVEESDKNLCNVKIESEEDKSVPGSSGLTVKEKLYDVVVGLEAGQSIPNYSVFRNGLEHNTSEKDKLSSATSSSESRHWSEEDKSCEKDKFSSDNRGKSVGDDGVEIISDSDSETKEKVSAKKKLFEESSRGLEDSTSVTKDDSSETEEEDSEDSNVKDDDVMVDSLSSSDDSSASFSSSSSSSSSSEDLKKARSPIRKVSNLGRKPLRRSTRSGSCSAMPIKEDKKIQKVNHREEEEVLSQTRLINSGESST